MSIEGLSFPAISSPSPSSLAVDEVKPAEAPDETCAAAAEAEEAPAEGKQKGVIRNLLAGHFKGVADLRLRINFHEEIAALEGEARVAALGESAESLVSELSDRASEGLAALELDEESAAAAEELLAGFQAEADEALAAFAGEEGGDLEILGADLRQALDAFAGQLRELLSPAGEEVAETPAEPTALTEKAEETAEETSSLDAWLAELSVFFEAGLEQLGQQADGFSLLPPLSEPRGQGVAYAKFLAIYEGLRAPAEEAPEDAKPLDAPVEPALDLQA